MIRLDARIFQTLWENQHLIPEAWKYQSFRFDGTILRGSYGGRYVLALGWRESDSEWGWRCHAIGNRPMAWSVAGSSWDQYFHSALLLK